MKNSSFRFISRNMITKAVSYIAVRISKWFIHYYFCQFLKKSETSIYQPVHPFTTNKSIFIKLHDFYYRRRVDFMHNIVLVAVRLGSEAAVWRCSGKCVLLYDEKSIAKFQQSSSFLSKSVDYRPAMLNFFTGNFITFKETFPGCSQVFKTLIYRTTSHGCFRMLFLSQLKKISQCGSTWFSIESNSFKFCRS